MANELTRIIQKFNVTKDKLEALKMDRFNKLFEERTKEILNLYTTRGKAKLLRRGDVAGPGTRGASGTPPPTTSFLFC